ncbi:site-specific integrase [Chromobacterium haemolyticum]|uniref:hypothetical protein n=1 Tax=Chromobacterium haemolyticum TaxID=394935 RepID=UPI002953B582|nr:hypothetical protein [Chromobacterium haemolyticum]WON83251.1 hypothetical protein OK026_19280 [Chromobacterium haemolyticum]
MQVDTGERGMAGWKFDGGRLLPWWNGNDSPMALKQTTALLSRQYARIFEAARCVDFGFHDLRHEATSRIFERTKLSDLQIAKITGHKIRECWRDMQICAEVIWLINFGKFMKNRYLFLVGFVTSLPFLILFSFIDIISMALF